MVRPTFFPCLPGGVRACQDGLEYFFSIFAHLTEGRGGYLGNAHIEPTNFKKGASLTSISKCWIGTRFNKKLLRMRYRICDHHHYCDDNDDLEGGFG